MRISDWSSDVCSSDLLAQAVAVALAVAELQRVERHLRQLDRLELAVVKQQLQAPPRGDPHVEAAVRADPQAVLQLAVENHLAAELGRASGRERVCQYV